MTRKSVQPQRNPQSGEKASRRYTYCPPAFGIIAANSPYDSAAVSVSNPVTIQTTSNQPGEPTCRAIIDETMKIPEPIIEPATSMVESSKPSPLTNFCPASGVSLIAVVIWADWIWRRVNHHWCASCNAKKRLFKTQKCLRVKKNCANLPPRADLKSPVLRAEVSSDFLRCVGTDCRIGCRTAGRLRAGNRAV